MGVIFLDLATVFDCVNHDILLQELDRHGIRGGAYGWVKNFLCGRTQQVCVQNTLTKGLSMLEFLEGLYLDPYCSPYTLMIAKFN